MTKKRKQHIPERGSRKKEEKSHPDNASKDLSPGDILIYESIIKDTCYVDEAKGKIYLCLGEAAQNELGQLGEVLSSSFASIKIIAVLEPTGDVDFFLSEELSLFAGEPKDE